MKQIIFFLLIITILISCIPALVQAQDSKKEAETMEPKSTKELESFLDDYLNKHMKENHIPGLSFSFVKDGDIFFQKGYGLSDFENQTKVDSSQTIFNIASGSKLITATATMQLVDQGKIKLDEDVNVYLRDFKIPKTFNEPVTVANLLTHTAGFEDRYIGMATYDQYKILTLNEYLKNHLPGRMNRPGEVFSYNNYGYVLLGYVIEQISGVPFDKYVETNILTPLEMKNSSFRQPLDSSFQSRVGKSYVESNGQYEQIRFAYWHGYPETNLWTTAEDMTHFMIAQLNQGKYKNFQLLKPESVEKMQSEQYSSNPVLQGRAYGFDNSSINGHQVVMHSGGASGWSAYVYLFPEYNQGFFFNTNVENNIFDSDFIEAFTNKFYPSTTSSLEREANISLSQKELKKFEGYYRWARHSESSLDKLRMIISPEYNANIKANDDGSLSVSFMFAPSVIRYEPIGPLVFQKVAGEKPIETAGFKVDMGNKLVFRQNGQGEITYALADFEDLAMKKISWYEYSLFHLIFMVGFILIFLSYALTYPVMWIIRKLRRKPSKIQPRFANIVRITTGILSLLNVVMLVVFVMFFNESAVFGLPMIINIALVVPIINCLTIIGLIMMMILSWRKAYWTLPARIHYTLLVVSVGLFIIWLNYWQMLGWKY